MHLMNTQIENNLTKLEMINKETEMLMNVDCYSKILYFMVS